MVNREFCILYNENGIRISSIWSQEVNVDLLRKAGKSLLKGLLVPKQILKTPEIYNRIIERSELIQMVEYILSSSVLTLNVLKHPKEEIELNNQVLHRLKRFMALVDFISTCHKDKNDFLGKWNQILNIITIMTNCNHTPTNHICVDLYPKTKEEDIYIQENQCFGLIVFVDSNSTFSFKRNENCIGLGITNTISCTFRDSRSSISINIFGNSLVQVVYPRNYNFVDERGMFVILNKNQEENTGIGEIISFGDLITRESNSYHLVGICSLDKTEQPNSLFLFSTFTPPCRIKHSSNDFKICFVLMISLPMSHSLVHLLIARTPLKENKKKFLL